MLRAYRIFTQQCAGKIKKKKEGKQIMTITAALLAIIIMATLIQFLTDVVKGILPNAVIRFVPVPLIAALIGVALAVIFQIDLFLTLGFGTQYAMASWVFTGLILSSGSSAVHELLSKLRASRGDLDDGDY